MVNLRNAVKPGGLVAIEARNQLFGLFTLNRYSYEFFVEELIRTPSLAAAGADAATLTSVVEQMKERFRMDLPPTRRGKSGEPGYDQVLSRTDNPFTLKQKFETAGFEKVETLFYHYHCLPPMFEQAMPEFSFSPGGGGETAGGGTRKANITGFIADEETVVVVSSALNPMGGLGRSRSSAVRIAFHVPRASHLEPGPSGDRVFVAELLAGLRERGHEPRTVSRLNARDVWRGQVTVGGLLCEALRVRRIDVGFVVDEERGDFVVAVEDGRGKRRLAVAGRGVDVRAGANQES